MKQKLHTAFSLTLVELLLAIALFSLVAFTGINLFRIGMNSYRTSENFFRRNSYAEEILKKIRYDTSISNMASVTDNGMTLVLTGDRTIRYSMRQNHIVRDNYRLTDEHTISNLNFSTSDNKYINIELTLYSNSDGQTDEITFTTGFLCKQ